MLLLSTALKFTFFAVLCLKLWFSGIDPARFHNFVVIFRPLHFLYVFSFCHIIILSADDISHYWPSIQGTIEHLETFKYMNYVFDTTSSKKLNDFFLILCFTVVFTSLC